MAVDELLDDQRRTPRMAPADAISPPQEIELSQSGDSHPSGALHRLRRRPVLGPSFSGLESRAPERWMSGLSRTPGKRVGVNSPPRVRIPLSPPEARMKRPRKGPFYRQIARQR